MATVVAENGDKLSPFSVTIVTETIVAVFVAGNGDYSHRFRRL